MRPLAMALLLAATAAAPLQGIPAFARKYSLTCMTCHDPIPRLNSFGEQFAARGYVLSDEDTTGMTSLGDPLLMLNTSLPIAIRFDAYFRYINEGGARTDFQTPTIAKLLTGGQIAKNVSYYLYLLLAEEGATGPIEDAWVMFRQPIGVPADVTVGQFQIIDPLWKRELRIALEDYAILSYQAGQGAANLTYDRGVIVSASPFSGTTVVGEVFNGNGIGGTEAGNFDGDAPKSGAAFLIQEVGPFHLAVLGYYGKQRVVPSGGGARVENLTRMVGPGIQARLGRFDVGAQWIYRDDTDPEFSGTDALATTRGGFAEVNWWPMGRQNRLLVTGLYNVVNSNSTTGDYESLTANISWLAARNIRLAAEGTYDNTNDRTSIGLGIVTAF